MRKPVFVLFLSVVFLVSPLSAEDALFPELRLYFDRGCDTLSLSFGDNGTYLDGFLHKVASLSSDGSCLVRGLRVRVCVPPVGDFDFCEVLALRRASAVRRVLDGIPGVPADVVVSLEGVDWALVSRGVRESACPWKEEVLAVTASPWASRYEAAALDSLRRLAGGEAWSWLAGVLSSPIFSPAVVTCDAVRMPSYVSVFDNDTVRALVADMVDEALLAREQQRLHGEEQLLARIVDERLPASAAAGVFPRDSEFREPLLAFRTNLCLPLLNAGVEVPVRNCMSLSLDIYFPWMQRSWMNALTGTDNLWCMQGLAAFADVRWWPGSLHSRDAGNGIYRLRGHSLALVFGCGLFDVGIPYRGSVREGLMPLGEGWQGRGLAAGVSYMYTLPLGRGGVHLSFEASFGYVHAVYDRYCVYSRRDARPYLSGSSLRADILAPFRAGVSLAVPVFRPENNMK